MTQLYRHFDKADNLLYIGISLSTIQRLSQHRQTAHWFDQVTRVSLQKFKTRREALLAEKEAIKVEKPLYNIQHNNLPKKIRKLPTCLEVIPDKGNYYTVIIPDKYESELYVEAASKEDAIVKFKEMLLTNKFNYWDNLITTVSDIASEGGLLKRNKQVKLKSYVIDKELLGFKPLETIKTTLKVGSPNYVTIPQSLLKLVDEHHNKYG